MLKSYIGIIVMLFGTLFLAGCREDDFDLSNSAAKGGEVIFQFEIEGPMGNTRGIMEDSKKSFEIGELIHVRAIFRGGSEDGIPKYGVYKYADHGIWQAIDADHSLHWPDDAEKADFTAYYIYGSTDILTENTMPSKLLSEYRYEEVPLKGVTNDVRYGDAVKLRMKHVFAYITLSELQAGASNELWFYVPKPKAGETPKDEKDHYTLNNAFTLQFDPETYEMTEIFSQIPSTAYYEIDGDGSGERNGLVYIQGFQSYIIDEERDEYVPCVSYLVEPGTYHQFSLLFPRTRDTYSTYLTYSRNLEEVTGPEGLQPNGRYVFSILKSLGVNIDHTPDDGWDDSSPHVILDVEKFLRAINGGTNYSEYDEEIGEEVQILEQTQDGTRLLKNVDFDNFYYDVFENGNWRPTQTRTFDGNYHYIWNMGCPLFYQNSGTITNVGIRDASTSKKNRPIVSCENMERWGRNENVSVNGFISCINSGTVLNVRVINADMQVEILTSDKDEPTQESHSASLLFGENSGNAYDISLAGDLELTVRNAQGETIMPRVMIGGVVGQNTGLVSGLTYINEATLKSPEVKIYNQCRGSNGAYKVGGVAGLNTGRLVNIFLNSVEVEAGSSLGVESYLGGLVGDNSYSNSGAPMLTDCIVRGEIMAGTVEWVINQNPISYAGGLAGSFNTQGFIDTCSISVGVKGSSNYHRDVEFAEGGAFGLFMKTSGSTDGDINNLACYGSRIEGNGTNDHKGNFAGIVYRGYTLDDYAGKNITVRQLTANDVGLVR